MRSTLSIFAAAALALTAGCPMVAPVEKPTVKPRGVTLVSISWSGVDARVDVDIINPNAIALPLRLFDWELSIGGGRAVTGKTELSESIPAKSSAPVATTIRLGASEASDVGSRIVAGRRDYRLKGTLHFSTSLGDLRVPFTQDGHLADR